MGAKHAGIHLRCEDSGAVLAKLKEKFDAQRSGLNKKEADGMEFIRSIVQKSIAKVADPAERTEKMLALEQIIANAQGNMAADEPAVIAVGEHFVSIYWYDHIREDNLPAEMLEYATVCGVPAMGVSVYDDTNFTLCAVCNAGTPNVRRCSGAYMFDHDDISPVEAETVCDTIGAPFLLDALKKTLSCRDGERMAAVFEAETGIPIFLDETACAKSGMKALYKWKSAVVVKAGD